MAAAAMAASSASLSAGQVAAASGSLSTATPRQSQQRGQAAGSSAVLVVSRLSRDDHTAAQCSAFSATEMFGASSAAALRQQPLCATPVAGGSQHQRSAIVCKVNKGDPAPPLALKDQNGRTVKLSSFKGKNVILYFYPKDDTPGCTKEACAFRDAYQDFRRAGAVVIGVSSDSPESHKEFAEKYDLPYVLLSDEGGEARKEWGVPGDLFGILPGRQTYVINKKGIVQLIFNNQFQPEKHVDEALKILTA